MTDIVKRLQVDAIRLLQDAETSNVYEQMLVGRLCDDVSESADEIVRLRTLARQALVSLERDNGHENIREWAERLAIQTAGADD